MDMSHRLLSPRAVILTEEVFARAEFLIKEKHDQAEFEARQRQAMWKAERRVYMCADGKVSDFEADSVLDQALDKDVLSGCFIISIKQPGLGKLIDLTVTDILADVTRYNGLTTLDPVEPGYDGGRLVGKLLIDGDRPVLVSLAHGKTIYQLKSAFDDDQFEQQDVEYSPKTSSKFVDRCVDLMGETGQYYSSGTVIVFMSQGKAVPIGKDRLAYELSKLVSAFTSKATRNGPSITSVAISDSIIKQVLEVGPDRLPKIYGVSDHPLVLPDGTLLDEPGYDRSTGLIILNGRSRFPPVHQNPTDAQLLDAVEMCMSPFSKYHFVNEASGKTAVLSSVLLAVLRPGLATGPLIATTSKKTGAGKGYFQQAISVIATGRLPQFRNVERSNAPEVRKVLFTVLLERDPIIAFDNMDGLISNESLSSFLTSPMWSDRILGSNRSGGLLRNDLLMTLNGVNLSVGKNIARKVLMIELQEMGADHRFRKFDFLPHQKAKENRSAIIAAALTIACHAANCISDAKTIGSFEEFTDIVRVPIADIASRLPTTGLVDPITLFEDMVEKDVDTPAEIELLELIYIETKGETFTTSELRLMTYQNGGLDRAMREFCATSPTMTNHSVAAILTQLRGELLGDFTLHSRKTRVSNQWVIEKMNTVDEV